MAIDEILKTIPDVKRNEINETINDVLTNIDDALDVPEINCIVKCEYERDYVVSFLSSIIDEIESNFNIRCWFDINKKYSK